MRFRALDAAGHTEGHLVGPDVEIDGVSFDSRALRPGQLFVPIVAARDGHDFVVDAVDHGAVAYLTSRGADARVAGRASAIVVDDTLVALNRLAAARRARAAAVVVGVTGSVGKTSTKDLAAAALGASRRVWANERSFNNDQGLPTTVLNAPDDTEVLVLEMGMRGFGEIARLCSIAAPDIGVVTRVAEAHSERVGGVDGVARAKAELVEALPSGGVAVLNADDERVRAMAARCAGRVLTYGEAPDADVRVERVALDDTARATFRVRGPWPDGALDIRLAVSGRHMVSNAAAAMACVAAVGADATAGAAALASAALSPMRMDVVRTASGAVVVDDCYNANPTSMRAALDALAAIPAQRRLAVLGEMAEITDPDAEHRRLAAQVAAAGIELVAMGTERYGLRPALDVAAVLERVGNLGTGDAVLVKASRAARLEAVVAALVAHGGGRST